MKECLVGGEIEVACKRQDECYLIDQYSLVVEFGDQTEVFSLKNLLSMCSDCPNQIQILTALDQLLAE